MSFRLATILLFRVWEPWAFQFHSPILTQRFRSFSTLGTTIYSQFNMLANTKMRYSDKYCCHILYLMSSNVFGWYVKTYCTCNCNCSLLCLSSCVVMLVYLGGRALALYIHPYFWSLTQNQLCSISATWCFNFSSCAALRSKGFQPQCAWLWSWPWS